VVENFRPGHLAALGLGPDVLRAAKPDLIIAHISGYGQNGPYRDRPAFGAIGEAIGGLRYLTDHPPGTSDLPPVRVGVSIGDSLSGLYAAFGIMAALWQRDRAQGDGQPRTLDVALTESVFSLMEGMLSEYGALGKIRQPAGGGIPTAAPSNLYRTSDNRWVLIAANSEPLFARLCALMGRPNMTHDSRFVDNPARVCNSAVLDRTINDWTVDLSADALLEKLEASGIPASRIYNAADCAADPQYRFREMVREVEHPVLGKVLQAGIVPTIPEGPGTIRWAGPDLGQHTEEVLTGLLGLSSRDIDGLRTAGAIR
jgi:crotonobetainyl-CoA:carnitine CoA-transferase CaiB-like acyl-CoA transferase